MKLKNIIFSCLMCLSTTLMAEEWKAKFLTLEHSQSRPCTWAIWKKNATLEKVPQSLKARIVTDTKYWLWINDQMVVFEGGLKRGPAPLATYYDEVEIASYLKQGENTISVLTWHYGLNGFSHVNSGSMGLVFQAIGEGVEICTDISWRGDVYEAYSETGAPRPNYRISENNIRFDAREALDGWYKSDYDGHIGDVLAMDVCQSPWGELVKRPIPQWKDSGLRDYVSTEMKGDTLYCYLPYNCQLTPYIKLRSQEEGLTVKIQTDVHMISDSHTIRCEYVTREGEQEYENYAWMNGHQVWYILPKGVEVLDVKFRESGYGADFVEPFRCNDELLTELWKRAQRTLYITMRDNYMDCPDRERGQWWGDAVNEIGETFYCLTTPAQQLAAKGLQELFGWQRENGELFAPCPAGNWNRELPSQILAATGFYGIYLQCYYSDDFSVAERNFDRLHKYLHETWQRDAEGFTILRNGGWLWGDWGSEIDQYLLQNEWHYLAIKGESLIARRIGRTEVAEEDERIMAQFKDNFDKKFWTGTCYRSPDYEGETDDRVNALAVVSGLASADKYKSLIETLTTEYHASPYMEKYVLEALFVMNANTQALQRIRKRYGAMIAMKEVTTLPENWMEQGRPIQPGEPIVNAFFGTYNHGWTGGPLTLLSQKVCGIEPTSPGFRTFRIRPQMGDLKEASCTVESVCGKIGVQIVKKGRKLTISAQVPLGTQAEVVFPSGKTVLLEAGDHIITK